MELHLRRNGSGDGVHSTVIRHIYRTPPVGHPSSPKQQVEKERRLRRQIANNNERRRMQSINSGFEKLRALLQLDDGEKFISKSALLQATARHITELYAEREQLLSEVKQLRQFIHDRLGIEPEIMAPVRFTEDDSVMEDDINEEDDDNNLNDGHQGLTSSSSAIVGSDGSANVVEPLSPSTDVLCSPLNNDDGTDNAKRHIQFGLEDRLCLDSAWQPSVTAAENFRSKLRARVVSGHSRNHVAAEPAIELRQENNVSFDDTTGRNNLEIILTAIQHIERSGHETFSVSNTSPGAEQIESTSTEITNSSNLNINKDPTSRSISLPAGIRRQTLLVQPIGGADGNRQQQQHQLQRIPTILLHRVATAAASDGIRTVGVSQQSQSTTTIKAVAGNKITSNILVLNSPTVTLTGVDGGELQYHLAAVTNK